MKALDEHETASLFAEPASLPTGYGAEANERVVEIPWALAQGVRGRTLDAGSALNHEAYLDRLLPQVDELHIVTLEPEPAFFPERRVSYVYGDLRSLPYRDGYFDTIISISTLEHVGMDNRGYGAVTARAADPEQESELAVRELRRILAPGGRFLLSLPYGEQEDHGAFRQLNRSALDRLISAAEPEAVDLRVYRYVGGGWQLSDLERASDARYRVGSAAEAVSCVCLSY